jgi:hypothetical protein
MHRRRETDDASDKKPLTDTEMTAMLDTYEKQNPAGRKRKKRRE